METADQMQLDVAIEDAGTSAKKVTITIPAEAVDEKIEMSFGTLQDQAQMRGFRKGRAPRQLLEKRFGKDLIQEARGQLVGAAYQQAIQEKELRVVGDPIFPDELAEKPLERGKPFIFDFTVEVVPDFELPELEGVELKKPIIEIDADHVDAEMTRLRYRLGTPERISGPFEPLDRTVGSAKVTVEDHEGIFFETEQALLVVPAEEDEGKGQLLGLIIDDLGPMIVGKKTGDTLEIETVGPPTHERAEVRGKKVSITFTINDAERITALEPDQLAEQLGLEDINMVQERVKLELETRRDTEQRNAEREQVYEYLLANTTLALPERMSEAQVARTIERQRMEMLYRGDDPEAVEKQLAEMRGQNEEQSLNRLKLLFIMDQVARTFELQVTEEEINGRIAMIAQQRNERPDQVRSELNKSGGINDVARQIVEHKGADRIVDQAKVTEVPAAEWNKEAEAKAIARRTGSAPAGEAKTTKKKTAKKTTKKTADKKAAKKTTKKTAKKTSKKSD
jgi:trigger factor